MSEEDLDEMFEELDADKNGVLHESEVWESLKDEIGDEEMANTELTGKLQKMLKESDKNSDGVISKPELASFVQAAESVLDELDEDDMDGASSFLEEDDEDEEE